MHSWRVLMLPYLGHEELYKRYRFDEPWNGPNNRRLAAEIPRYYRCPSADSPSETTNYVVVVGPNTAFPGAEKVKYDDITDGLSNTLLFVEVADSDIHWMEPRDLRFDEMDFTINGRPGKSISSRHDGVVLAGRGDASTMPIPITVSAESVKAALTIAGGESYSFQ